MDGELAVVLSWTQGAKVHGNQVDLQGLDLHVEFEASDTVKCNVDYTMRQCNGVKMTADNFITDNKLTTVQAIKFDKIGDFEYMVYASRDVKTQENTQGIKNMELQASLSIYSPRHSQPIYTVELPFINSDNKENYWIGFCLRGGRGINFNGVSVSDPNALFMTKPSVQKQCILDNEHIGTVSIPPPTGVEAATLSNDQVELTWEQPTITEGPPILKYRIFVAEKNSKGSTLSIETSDAKTSYKLRTPKAMYGREYVFSVQAINRQQKMSLVSD